MEDPDPACGVPRMSDVGASEMAHHLGIGLRDAILGIGQRLYSGTYSPAGSSRLSGPAARRPGFGFCHHKAAVLGRIDDGYQVVGPDLNERAFDRRHYGHIEARIEGAELGLGRELL